MKKFGIIAAMQEEMQEIQKIMDDAKKTKIYDLNFIKGKIGNYEVVLVEAGVGKVNAARTTQILIDNFEIDAIINVGSAAAANEKLNIGDIVIANKLVQHDFDITAFGHPKGYISNVGQYLESDKELVINIEKAIKKIDNNKFKRTETVEAVPVDVALGSFRVDVLAVGKVETPVIVLGVIGAV